MSILDYAPSPLDPDDFKFDAPLLNDDRVKFSLLSAQRVGINEADAKHLGFVELCNPLIASHAKMSEWIAQVSDNHKMGTNEDALHSRDDLLLQIIEHVGSVITERNKISSSTLKATRLDAYLYESGRPPVVIVEEKASGDMMQAAVSDITTKVRFLPHYQKLSFLIGIAIAGDEVRMFKLCSDSSMQDVTTFSLTSKVSRMACVQAVINVGRWCKYLSNNKLVFGLAFAINQTNTNDRRSLCIGFTAVDKTYLKLSVDERKQLKQFYVLTVDIPFLERAISVNDENGKLSLSLEPVGIERLPTTKVELQKCLKCILTALSEVHAKGWCLVDLRWPNIVNVGDDWYIIDCEFARPFNSVFPADMKVKPEFSSQCSAYTDLFMVGRMLKSISRREIVDDTLQNALLDAHRNTIGAVGLLKHRWLARIR
jgi:hypothetical protein